MILLLAALTLFQQSTVKLLESRFPDEAISYILTDARTGAVLAERWHLPDVPVPAGSLVKPFLVPGIPPDTRYRCDGRLCWHRPGHGELGLPEAIAYSCNAYFLAVARMVANEKSPTTLIGLGDKWRLTPRQLTDSYRTLLSRSDAEPLREGMRLSARKGTGRLAQVDAWVKTGTAPCSHAAKAPGDGFTVVADENNILLMRVHGTTGSEAARTAGAIWRAIHDGR